MKQAWHPDELTHHWTLSDDEYCLLGEKTGATRLAFAVLLKAFQYEGRFPLRRDTVPVCVIMHLAAQVAVPLTAYATVDWDGVAGVIAGKFTVVEVTKINSLRPG